MPKCNPVVQPICDDYYFARHGGCSVDQASRVEIIIARRRRTPVVRAANIDLQTPRVNRASRVIWFYD